MLTKFKNSQLVPRRKEGGTREADYLQRFQKKKKERMEEEEEIIESAAGLLPAGLSQLSLSFSFLLAGGVTTDTNSRRRF